MTAVTSTYVPARRSRLLSRLNDAAGLAAMALVLALPLVGFQIADVPGGTGLGLRLRLMEVAVVVAVAFFGKLGLDFASDERPLPAMGIALAAFLATASLPSETPTIPFIVAAAALTIAAKAALRAVALGQADPRLLIGGGLLAATAAGLEIGPLGVLWPLLAFAGLAVAATAAWRRYGPDAQSETASTLARRLRKGAGPVLIVLAVSLPFTPFADSYGIDVATLVLTYIMLGWGLNVVVGLAGLLDLGYVGFYAVGAYTFALLATQAGLSFWVCLPAAGLMAALFGIILGFPVLRLRGDYLAIVTLGFGEIIRIVLINWGDVTGGPNGIANIPRPTLFGMPFTANPPDGVTSVHMFFGLEFSSFHRMLFLYFLILGLALATNAITLRLRRLPVGRAWEALREDEIACRALGINPTVVKLSAFALGAAFAGFAGSFFATRQGFVSPESFTFPESAVILAIVVLGGRGSQLGVVVSAFLLIGVPEIFRDLQEYRMLAFGLAMIGITIWRPNGLLAHRKPTITLPESQPHGQESRS